MKEHEAMPVYTIGIAQFAAAARNLGRANNWIDLLFRDLTHRKCFDIIIPDH